MLRSSYDDTGRLRPGEIVPQSGIYRVYHRAHRLPHNAYIAAGTRLPPCVRCGHDVEFGLLMTAPAVDADPDFRDTREAAA